MASLSSLLRLGSAIPGSLALTAVCRFVIWPSPSCVGLLAGLLAWSNKTALLSLVDSALPYSGTAAGAFISIGTALLAYRLWKAGDATRCEPWSGLGKVFLMPSRTTHARMFPERHSFSYSYLLVGIPVGWSGTAGGMVSVDLPSEHSKGWYHVNAADYLERGNGHLGLRGKLDAYLDSVVGAAIPGADPGLYPFAYLVTAAKFLGYHFNPVSFWYLYGPDKALAAMVLEVNNTFGERRMYFLQPSESPKQLENSDTESVDASQPQAAPKFTQTWPKDFHVSPFNSRKGSYSVNARDVLSSDTQGSDHVDVTIILRSSKTRGKLFARIFSERPAIDPTKLSIWQKLSFLVQWWWVGFVTFPRIVKEAGLLFFVRKLHVWFRPEPLKESMSRAADDTEHQLEVAFRKYLRHLVENSTSPLAVKYVPAGVSDTAKELMMSPGAQKESAEFEELEFKVLTPVFYARFVCYAHDLEAFFCELRDSSTIWLSKPELLPKLALKKPSPPLEATSYVDFVLFKAIQALRRRPERIERPLTSSQKPTTTSTTTTGDLRGFRISSMDAFVLSSEDVDLKSSYRRAVLKLFIADRVALGMVPLLEAQTLLLRAVITKIISKQLSTVVEGIFRRL